MGVLYGPQDGFESRPGPDKRRWQPLRLVGGDLEQSEWLLDTQSNSVLYVGQAIFVRPNAGKTPYTEYSRTIYTYSIHLHYGK